MSRVEELENEIKGLENRKIELLKQLELEKLTQEIELPFKTGNVYFSVTGNGRVIGRNWTPDTYHADTFLQGNAFRYEQEAEKERDRRILLTRFRQFRDKCNGDWEPAWKEIEDSYNYYIEMAYVNGHEKLRVDWSPCSDSFNLFGYFKNKEDANSAIELFGDEIKRLWVDE